MKIPHLNDDELAALCLDLDAAPPAAPAGHLAACTACQTRRAALAAVLHDVTRTAAGAADAAFPPERLARQQARILQRIERQPPGGRVLPFPRADAPRTPFLQPRPARRWIAGAAAAGLLIGMFAGRLVHELPVLHTATSADTAPVQQARAALVAGSPLDDDQFLLEVQAAVERLGPAAFEPLVELTPAAWEVR